MRGGAARADQRRAARRRAHAARDRRRTRNAARSHRKGGARRREPVRAPAGHVTAAYKAPDASAASVLGAIARRVPASTTPRPRAALERIARDFDRGARVRRAVGSARSHRRDRGRAVGGDAALVAPSTVEPAAPVADEPRNAGRDAQAVVQRVVAQRVRRVRAQVVVPLRVRGGRRPRLVGLVLRHRVPRGARRLSLDAHALRRGRPRRARRRFSTTASSPRSTVTARVSTRRSSSSCRNGARGAPPRSISAGCSSARAARRSRSSAARPQPTSSSAGTLRRLHRPARPRRPHRHRDRGRLQDRLDRDQRRRVPRRGARLSRVPAALLLLGAHRRGRRRDAASRWCRSRTRCSTSRRSSSRW